MNNKGMTLIELLIVIGIIGILAAIAIPGYIGQQRRAARTEASSNLENLRLLQEQFFADNGQYAPSGSGVGTEINFEVGDTAISNAANLPGFKPGNVADLNYDYVIRITAANSAEFTARAEARPGSRVAGDANCTIDHDNIKTGPCW